jgi:hypothetical protein
MKTADIPPYLFLPSGLQSHCISSVFNRQLLNQQSAQQRQQQWL